MNRPIPPHGSEGRYKGSATRNPCRCDTCVRGRRLACVRRDLIKLRGGWNRAPRAVVAAHIARLQQSGMSQETIARLAAVSNSTISLIVNGKTSACQRAQAQRILALRPASFDGASTRPAFSSARRIQALLALGHGQAAIAAASGLTLSTISTLANDHCRRVDNSTAQKAAKAYERLASTPGDSRQAKRRADKKGWLPPAYWDDDTIDDPNFVPAATVDSENKQDIAAWRAEEIRHLGQFDISVEDIADRLDVSPAYVRDQLRGDRLPGTRSQKHLEAA